MNTRQLSPIRTQRTPTMSFTPVSSRLLQRKCACGGMPGVSGECEECRKKKLQRPPSSLPTPFSVGHSPSTVSELPPIVHEVLHSPGRPLDPSTPAFMEARFGHDFSRTPVRAAGPGIPQAKLMIGQPNDQYEQEADRMASEIAGMSSSQIEPGSGEGQPGTCDSDRFTAGVTAQIPLGDWAGSPGGADPQAQSEEDQKDIGGGGFGLTPQDEAQFQAMRGHGQPLAAAERAFMEPRFGHSFSQVRVHNDAKANELAWGVGARAFTVGQDVVFREGEYSPGSADGRRLLAHELTHVLQQSPSGPQSKQSLAEPRVQRYLIGPPEFIGATTTTPETYGNCRAYNWVVDWSTTSLQDGFIIQEITNAGTITGCDGTNVTPPNTAHFWEAWPVTGGTVGDGGGDKWFRAARANTRGNWRLSGDAFAVSSLKSSWGFTAGGVRDANGLRSTTTGPNKDTELYQPSLSRTRGGVWNCCDGNNYHRAA
jgi:hypothetical protein